MHRSFRHLESPGSGAFTRVPGTLLVAAALLVFSSGTSVAQQPSKEEIQQFKRSMAKGAEHYKKEEYDRALESFEKAQEIASPPSLKYNIARTYEALHQCDKAEAMLEKYLAEDGLSEAKNRRARSDFGACERNAHRPGKLAIACSPTAADAKIVLENRELACPAAVELEAGKQTVRVRAPGYQETRVTATIQPGKTVNRQVDLVETPSDPQATTDGTSGGGATAKRIIQYSTIAVGLGLVGGGLASDLQTNGRLADIQKAREAGNAQKIRRLEDEGEAATTRAAIFYISGGALAIGATSWLMFDLLSGNSSSETSGRARIDVSLTPRTIQGRIRW